MRVIAGQWKGLSLSAPPGSKTRPTTDRVKESMFNLMGPGWSGGIALDVFAGSGALGIEALSRGADKAILVDRDRRSVLTIRENVARTKSEEGSFTVLQMDWKQALGLVGRETRTLGWVFVDPPYTERLWVPVLEKLSEFQFVVEHGIVCEHPRNVLLPIEILQFEQTKSKSYGDISLSLYKQSPS